MQDKYAGDIGDFGKLALLRELAPGRKLGVCWYRTDGSGEAANDGRHVNYLKQPARFRRLDEEVFDSLERFLALVEAAGSVRSVESLEQLKLLPADTAFHRTICPRPSAQRLQWAHAMVAAMTGADLVFLDPDNGLQGNTPSPKSVLLAELEALRERGRSVLLYHHQSRFPGGAHTEAPWVAARLRQVGYRSVRAVRLRPYSSRFYFLLDADLSLINRLKQFAARWHREAELFERL